MRAFALAAISAAAVLPFSAAAETFTAPSGEYQSEDTHRYITFSYLHLGLSRPTVQWNDWDATLNWNAEDPAASSVRVTINTASVDSGVEELDDHLRNEDFFDVENNAEITFVSTKIETTGDNTGVITGDLTIKGVTKSVSLDTTYNASLDDTRKKRYKIGFSATTTVKRSDFGLGLYVPLVSDEVEISIEAEFEKPAE